MKYYLGIDPSLSSTGVVLIDEDKNVMDADCFGRSLDASDNLDKLAQIERVQSISSEVNWFVFERVSFTDLAGAAVEWFSYGSQHGLVAERHYLYFSVLAGMQEEGWPEPYIPSPATLKKYAVGDGRAKKKDMVASLPSQASEFFAGLNVKKKQIEDLADAYYLACLARDVRESPELACKVRNVSGVLAGDV